MWYKSRARCCGAKVDPTAIDKDLIDFKKIDHSFSRTLHVVNDEKVDIFHWWISHKAIKQGVKLTEKRKLRQEKISLKM